MKKDGKEITATVAFGCLVGAIIKFIFAAMLGTWVGLYFLNMFNWMPV